MPIRQLFVDAIRLLGEFILFIGETLHGVPRMWKRRALLIRHCEIIGVSSAGVIVVAAVFLGAVMGYQLYVSFKLFNAEALLGGSVGVSLFRELGPVMTAIMVTGRAGAAMAAEIASMKISEQVDALEVMAVDSVEFLCTPRVVAGVIMLPLLSVFFSAIAVISAAMIACGIMGLDPAIYWSQFAKVTDLIDLVHCLVKGGVFGLVITWVSCFCGHRSFGGARAVGNATRNSVVASFLLILFMDYMLTSFLPFGYIKLVVTS